LKPATPIDSVRSALERMKPQMAMALPKHITPDRLVRVAMTAIQNTPKLLECDRTSLFAAIMSCCQLGLEPDGLLGQAYLIPFAGRVQFIAGYKGLIALARNSGDVLSISAHEVCAKDQFDYEFGLAERCVHKPASGERGEITHFYAIARFKDGGHHWDVLTKADVDVIRSRSPGKNSDAWKNHYVEMGKKTAIRRIAKYLPISVQRIAAIDDAVEAGHYSSVDSHGDVVIDAAIPAQEMITDEVVANAAKADALAEFEAA